MGNWQRLLDWVTVAWRRLVRLFGLVDETADRLAEEGPAELLEAVDTHTAVTFRAVTDAVVPATPELADELGPEHAPGGLAVGLASFHVRYIENGFQLGLPGVGFVGNAPLSAPVAYVLDEAARALLERGENESPPDDDHVVALVDPEEAGAAEVTEATGPFARLAPRDRLRAIELLDEFEVELPLPDGGLFEFDAGLVGQLVVGFAGLIYYSEWQGYDSFDRPPSERVHPNDPGAVQSWRQTGFPGSADGYAALRGYVGTPDGPLGAGETWATVEDGAVRIAREPGSFREDDYDTSGYEEPHPE